MHDAGMADGDSRGRLASAVTPCPTDPGRVPPACTPLQQAVPAVVSARPIRTRPLIAARRRRRASRRFAQK
eukprot:scaffold8799_cov89-Isochrysis_galbana.AAC.2